MRRFIYVPECQVFIRSEDRGVVYDVSEDVIRCEVARNLDAVSTVQVTLQNKFAKWTRKFKPMDRMVVYFARVGTPILEFSGYVDDAPFFQIMPQPVVVNGSCTLKLLQNTYFDPGLPFMIQYFSSYGWTYDPTSGTLYDPNHALGNLDTGGTLGTGKNEGTIAHIIAAVIRDVGGWPGDHIRIKKIPASFLKDALVLLREALAEEAKENAAAMAQLKSIFGVEDATGGGSVDPGQQPLDKVGNNKREIVYQISTQWTQAGMPPEIGVAASMVETGGTLNPNDRQTGGDFAMGLFQTFPAGRGGGQAHAGQCKQAFDHKNEPVTKYYTTAMQIDDAHNWWRGYKESDFPNVDWSNASDDQMCALALAAQGPGNPTAYKASLLSYLPQARTYVSQWGSDPGTARPPGANSASNDSLNPYAKNTPNYFQWQAGYEGLPVGTEITLRANQGGQPIGTQKAGGRAYQRGKQARSSEINAGSDTSARSAKGAKVANRVIRIAISQVGTPQGSPQVQKYQSVTGAYGQAWCGSFACWVFGQAGVDLNKLVGGGGASVAAIEGWAKKYHHTVQTPFPGCLVTFGHDEHVGIVVGVSKGANGHIHVDTVEGNTSAGVSRGSYDDVGDIVTVGPNSPNESAVFIAVPGVGKGSNAAATDASSGQGTGASTGAGSSPSASQTASIAMQSAFFTLTLGGNDTTQSVLLRGKRALANDVPLFEWVQKMVQASGRRMCSLPNGDFMAFFPDEFGNFGRTPYMTIEPIEITNFTIQVSDKDLATHVFGTGTMSGLEEVDSFARIVDGPSAVASVLEKGFDFFINQADAPDDSKKGKKGRKKGRGSKRARSKSFSPVKFLRRFGARPVNVDFPEIRHPVLIWMATWREFLKHWSNQFVCQAGFTFMPEVFPGGLVAFVVHPGQPPAIQMFVESVVHTFDRAAGCTTQAVLTSPAAIQKGDTRFGGMVLADSFTTAADDAKDKAIAKGQGSGAPDPPPVVVDPPPVVPPSHPGANP